MVPTYCVPVDQSTTYSATVRARDSQGKQSAMSDPVLIRYDIYVDGFLRRVVVGETTAEVDFYFDEQNVTIIAVDTADNESEPTTVPIHF